MQHGQSSLWCDCGGSGDRKRKRNKCLSRNIGADGDCKPALSTIPCANLCCAVTCVLCSDADLCSILCADPYSDLCADPCSDLCSATDLFVTTLCSALCPDSYWTWTRTRAVRAGRRRSPTATPARAAWARTRPVWRRAAAAGTPPASPAGCADCLPTSAASSRGSDTCSASTTSTGSSARSSGEPPEGQGAGCVVWEGAKLTGSWQGQGRVRSQLRTFMTAGGQRSCNAAVNRCIAPHKARRADMLKEAGQMLCLSVHCFSQMVERDTENSHCSVSGAWSDRASPWPVTTSWSQFMEMPTYCVWLC